ncbi:MAG: PorT family protein [Prevotellaceae bacterium]|nr:PorT family protein [Prevotellaceae bacterium]
MKKTVILAITAIVLATGAFAQEKKIEFGVKAGFNVAREIAEEGSTEMRAGFYGGVFAEFFISNRLGLQPGLVYSMQGGKSEGLTDEFDYVNLPVMLKIYVLKRDLSIDAGLQPGYMVSAKVSGNGGSADFYDIIDNKFDVAVKFGASYKFAKRFHAGIHYSFGTIKLVDGMDNRNAVIQIGAGVRF